MSSHWPWLEGQVLGLGLGLEGQVLGLGLGLGCQVLGLGLGLEGQVLGLGLACYGLDSKSAYVQKGKVHGIIVTVK